MKRPNQNDFVIICAFIGLLIATIFGISAQSIAYFINDQFPSVGLITVMSTVTFLSIGLYIIILTLLLIFKKVGKDLLIVLVLVGFSVSTWSFFVWAMWMG